MNLFNAMNLFKCFLWNLKIKVLFLLIKYEIIVFFIHYEGNAERRKFSFVCTAQCYQIKFQDIVNEILFDFSEYFFSILNNFTLFVQHNGSFGTSLPSIELEI